MIVRYESDGTIVMIAQNDHAQLSGLFAAHWGNDKFETPRPYASLVRAAMFHDRAADAVDSDAGRLRLGRVGLVDKCREEEYGERRDFRVHGASLTQKFINIQTTTVLLSSIVRESMNL